MVFPNLQGFSNESGHAVVDAYIDTVQEMAAKPDFVMAEEVVQDLSYVKTLVDFRATLPFQASDNYLATPNIQSRTIDPADARNLGRLSALGAQFPTLGKEFNMKKQSIAFPQPIQYQQYPQQQFPQQQY